MSHQPVLLKEVIEYLQPSSGQNFIDATFGAGGHTQAILHRIGPCGKLLALDADGEAVAAARFGNRGKNLILVQANFRQLGQVTVEQGFNKVCGILADLGLSTELLEKDQRGFSFQRKGPLDMRYDQKRGKTAGDLINKLSEKELGNIFWKYGEERFAKRIARAIVARRRTQHLETTTEFFDAIKQSLPAPFRYKAADTARRIFQALRIVVNDELEALNEFLPQALEALVSKGRIAIISFHSLEDRIVKKFFKEMSKGCSCPKDFPKCICEKKARVKIITPKPILPSAIEISKNSRAKSAKLRIAEKL